MQRVKWLFLPLLFVLFIHSSLNAISFKDIVFEPVVAEFQVEDEVEVQVTISNHAKLKVEVRDEQNQTQPTLSFYRYDASADSYLSISQTFYQPNQEVSGKFNPMTPLLLENGDEIDISKKLPAIKCQIFRRNEPLIIVYHDSNLSDVKCINLNITTNKDHEIIQLYRSDEKADMFVGYINTHTKCLAKYDGKLFVEKGTEIRASLEKESKKNRAYEKEIFAIAGVEHIVFETKAEPEKKEALIWASIEANKRIASVGEFIKYTIVLENRGDIDVENAVLISKFSSGLKYKLGTKEKKIKLLKAGDSKTLTFIANVDIDAKNSVQNSVHLLYNGKKSNQSSSEIKIERDFDDKSTIFGSVKLDQRDLNVSLSGFKIYLENGKYTVSDKYGKFHFSNIQPATHVVSIDPDSLDGKFTLTECKANARSLGSKTSHFVDTRSSHIKKVTFCVKQNRLLQDINSTLSFHISDERSEGMPQFTSNDFDKLKSGFLWPKEGFVPPMPSIKVAFMHKSDEKMELYLNGKKVDMLNYDGAVKSKDKKSVISKYRGVDIVDGDNILEARIGAKVIKRKIHLSTTPVKAVVLKDKSTLIADGKNPVVIAVQLFDAAGFPLRRGMVGKFSVEKPYLSQERLDVLEKNPLALGVEDDKYSVSKDGIAYIPLQATSRSGEVKLHFPFQNSNEYTKTWITAKARDWFIVGFAEGSVGYETLKEALKKSQSDEVVTQKKVSFFAKGKVTGDALLTIAYDSGKRSDLGILEESDLEAQYTIYADSTLQKNEAASGKKLYLKIEKKAFYALFGDFDTGLDTLQLSRYSRRLNGVKSEFHGRIIEYSAFVSQSNHSFQRDELQGDGTSGLYYLSSKDIVIGSEKVYVEVRDRYRDEIIISKKPMHPIYDYNIDYFGATLYFKEPILKRDSVGNPQFIVVEYELENGKTKSYTYGGRGAIKLFDGVLEIGATALGEENFDGVDTLYGFDAKLNAGNNIVINAEYAQTKTAIDSNTSTSNAYLVELSHHNQYAQTKLYFKKQEEGFGFGHQNLSQSATQKYGVDTTINYFKHVALKLSAFGDKSLKTGDRQNVAEAIAQYQRAGYLASLGYRYAKDSTKDSGNSQLISTISRGFFNNKLKLSAAYEFSLDGKSDEFHNRTFAEASYFINQYVEIFANHEILEGLTKKSNLSRAGVKGRPWSGATIESVVNQEFENDSPRLFGGLGIHQNWQVNKELRLSASLEREQTLKGDTEDKDFTAYALATNYRKDSWVYSTKGEYRTSQEEKKINFDLGIYTEVNKNLGFAFGARVNDVRAKENNSQDAELKFSLAKRDDSYLLLNQLKYLYNKEQEAKVSKIINSLLFEINPTNKTTFSAHYGLKYTQDWIDEKRYDSLIDTAGFEFIYDFNRRLELGFVGSFLHSYETKSMDESIGTYIGYNFFKNSWLGLGYNFNGFKESDFSSLRHSNQGAYLKFRLKFDQESLKDTLELF